MAFGAQINLPVAGKIRWIQNAVWGRLVRLGFMLRFQPNMICAGAMTAFARYPNYEALSVVPVGARIV
jgi:hypothetical protein